MQKRQGRNYGAHIEQVQHKFSLILRSMINASGSKKWSAADKLVLHAHVCTHKPLHRSGEPQIRSACIDSWLLDQLCLCLTKS